MREENVYDRDSRRPIMDGGEVVEVIGLQEEGIELGDKLKTREIR